MYTLGSMDFKNNHSRDCGEERVNRQSREDFGGSQTTFHIIKKDRCHHMVVQATGYTTSRVNSKVKLRTLDITDVSLESHQS